MVIVEYLKEIDSEIDSDSFSRLCLTHIPLIIHIYQKKKTRKTC